jgi:hypothetical protein
MGQFWLRWYNGEGHGGRMELWVPVDGEGRLTPLRAGNETATLLGPFVEEDELREVREALFDAKVEGSGQVSTSDRVRRLASDRDLAVVGRDRFIEQARELSNLLDRFDNGRRAASLVERLHSLLLAYEGAKELAATSLAGTAPVEPTASELLEARLTALLDDAKVPDLVVLSDGGKGGDPVTRIRWLIENRDALASKASRAPPPGPSLSEGSRLRNAFDVARVPLHDDNGDSLSSIIRVEWMSRRLAEFWAREDEAKRLAARPTPPALSAPFGGKTAGEIDPVEKPAGYNRGEVECVDALASMVSPEEFIATCRTTAVQYLWRFGMKDEPLRELRKARWWIEMAIHKLGGGPDPRETRRA